MKSALLVIDAQKVYTEAESELFCEDSKGTIKRINSLISSFQKKEHPIIFIRHEHKKNGSDLGRMFDFTGEAEDDFEFKEGTEEVKYDSDLLIPKDAIQIVKSRYSAFVGTDLEKKLRELKVETLVICGFMTNCCCETTARHAHDLDYYVDFIIDATGTPGTDKLDEKAVRNLVSQLLAVGFARVSNTKPFLADF